MVKCWSFTSYFYNFFWLWKLIRYFPLDYEKLSIKRVKNWMESERNPGKTPIRRWSWSRIYIIHFNYRIYSMELAIKRKKNQFDRWMSHNWIFNCALIDQHWSLSRMSDKRINWPAQNNNHHRSDGYHGSAGYKISYISV